MSLTDSEHALTIALQRERDSAASMSEAVQRLSERVRVLERENHHGHQVIARLSDELEGLRGGAPSTVPPPSRDYDNGDDRGVLVIEGAKK